MLKWFKNFFLKSIYKPPDSLDDKLEFLLKLDTLDIQSIYLIKYPFVFPNVYRYNKELEYILSNNLLEKVISNSITHNEPIISFLYFLSTDDELPTHPVKLIKNFLTLAKELNIRYNMYKQLPNKLPLSHNLRIVSLHIEHIEKIVELIYNIHQPMRKL